MRIKRRVKSGIKKNFYKKKDKSKTNTKIIYKICKLKKIRQTKKLDEKHYEKKKVVLVN